MQEFDYNELMTNDTVLLDWIITVEKHGCALVKNCIQKDTSGCDLIRRIGFVKNSHYG